MKRGISFCIFFWSVSLFAIKGGRVPAPAEATETAWCAAKMVDVQDALSFAESWERGEVIELTLDQRHLLLVARAELAERDSASADRIHLVLFDALRKSVPKVIRKNNISNPGLNDSDFIETAELGLLNAIEQYDPAFDRQFAPYVVAALRKKIENPLETKVPISGRLEEFLKALTVKERAIAIHRWGLGGERTYSPNILGQILKLSSEEIEQEEDRLRPSLLEALTGQRAREKKVPSLKVGQAKPPNPIVESRTVVRTEQVTNRIAGPGKELIAEAMGFLKQDQQILIRHRLGLGGARVIPLREMNSELPGVSAERLNKVEIDTVRKLREKMGDRVRDLLSAPVSELPLASQAMAVLMTTSPRVSTALISLTSSERLYVIHKYGIAGAQKLDDSGFEALSGKKHTNFPSAIKYFKQGLQLSPEADLEEFLKNEMEAGTR